MTTTDLDYGLLDRLMDRTKAQVFRRPYASFLGSIMSSLDFMWTEDIHTACTNGIRLQWNPHFFLALSEETRVTVLLHELWHVARLDVLRRGNRNPRMWNCACDLWINNLLRSQGASFKGFQPWISSEYDGWTTEDIYDDLMRRYKEALDESYGDDDDDWEEEKHEDAIPPVVAVSNKPEEPGEAENEEEAEPYVPVYDLSKERKIRRDQGPYPWTPWLKNPETGEYDESDLEEPGDLDIDSALIYNTAAIVLQAYHAERMGTAGSMPGEIEIVLKQFLQPKLPWRKLLSKFFTDMLQDEDWSWQKPNRRFMSHDLYLPGLNAENEGRLEHIMFFEDCSGSISDGDSLRFNSEFKYIKETFNPKKISKIQFDTSIQRVDVFNEEDPFEEIVVTGRGGTDLRCVRSYIIEHKPSVVVVLSDLECAPMEPLPDELKHVPFLWVCLNNPSAKVNFGQLIHLRD